MVVRLRAQKRLLQHRPCIVGLLCALPLAIAAGCNGSKAADMPAPPAFAPVEQVEAAPYEARKLFDFDDKRINESSGVAASRRYAGVLWTHNDSGDSSRLFMVSTAGESAGKTIAEVNLEGVKARDWEDMAIAGTGKDAWVYAADIGDNLRQRPEVVIYRFREPEVDAGKTGQSLTVTFEKMTLTYPDGAHDAESLIATPDGTLLIVSKLSTGESSIYRTPQPFAPESKQVLEKVGAYKFEAPGARSRMTTAGDLSADGRRLVIRTYTKAYQWTLPEKVDWTKVWPGLPQSWTLPETVQGEAICFSADGTRLFISSEQLPAPVHELVPVVAK